MIFFSPQNIYKMIHHAKRIGAMINTMQSEIISNLASAVSFVSYGLKYPSDIVTCKNFSAVTGHFRAVFILQEYL